MSLKTDANFKRSLRRVWSERSGPQISILTVASRSFSILTVNTDFSVSILFQQHAGDRTKTIVTVNTDFPITIVILHRKSAMRNGSRTHYWIVLNGRFAGSQKAKLHGRSS